MSTQEPICEPEFENFKECGTPRSPLKDFDFFPVRYADLAQQQEKVERLYRAQAQAALGTQEKLGGPQSEMNPSAMAGVTTGSLLGALGPLPIHPSPYLRPGHVAFINPQGWAGYVPKVFDPAKYSEPDTAEEERKTPLWRRVPWEPILWAIGALLWALLWWVYASSV